MAEIGVGIGASGFIGTRLIQTLSTNPQYQLKNIDLQPSALYNHITSIADVRSLEQMSAHINNTDCVCLLAAQHRDDVRPTSLYYDTNVKGLQNVLQAMEKAHVKRLLFISSVAIYGLNKNNPDETHNSDPFNHYGKSKWLAEQTLQQWYKTHHDWNINIIRPTVVFGENNRGNVYNLFKQIATGHFLIVGTGKNKKSMAYVGNLVAFINFLLQNKTTGYNVYNYVDKPDIDMNTLVSYTSTLLHKATPAIHLPYALGITAAYILDIIATLTRKKLPVSSVRVRKFCATTQFDATKAHSIGFIPPFTLQEGIARTLQHEFNTSTPVPCASAQK
ncbi:MAG: NAD-dependent epimerase/dehydratase family protein [Bacteroidaceae bacterium]|nr:NAD-dependent epimerase/dehydratase family protein [Bacteroidaceae bacterium]